MGVDHKFLTGKAALAYRAAGMHAYYAESREAVYERVCAMAGVTLEGAVLPPQCSGIDRASLPWWTTKVED